MTDTHVPGMARTPNACLCITRTSGPFFQRGLAGCPIHGETLRVAPCPSEKARGWRCNIVHFECGVCVDTAAYRAWSSTWDRVHEGTRGRRGAR